jgi:hypothetical protein
MPVARSIHVSMLYCSPVMLANGDRPQKQA